MKTTDFGYDLPISYVAQTPIEPRDHSRLMVVHRNSNHVEHRIFFEIGDYLDEGDVLVINRTRVIPARIFVKKPSGGKVELLLLRKKTDDVWEVLVGGKTIDKGLVLQHEFGFSVKILEELESSRRMVKFSQPIEPLLDTIGKMPLPPYIHEPLNKPERYQTVYADRSGSAAAPTAGLHFTRVLMDKLKARRIKIAEITLHVGLDTFAPVKEDDPAKHKIHQEWCELDDLTASIINSARSNGRKIIAVGTTTTRALETAANQSEEPVLKPFTGNTSLFILPGYQFKIVDGIITNFHLPRSTLIMMVSAFAGWKNVQSWYELAKCENYRFYSFGDAMLIL